MQGEEVPQTDEEVKATIEASYKETNRTAIQGIYSCYRDMGNSVADAWFNTLMKVIETIEPVAS